MKTSILNTRMESILITMNSLQQKYGSTKFDTLVQLMQSTPSSITLALYELRRRNLVEKEGRGKEAIYKVTAPVTILIATNKLSSFIKLGRIAPTTEEVKVKKQYEQKITALRSELQEVKRPKTFWEKLKNLFH